MIPIRSIASVANTARQNIAAMLHESRRLCHLRAVADGRSTIRAIC
jgi:hypothetical protein